MKKPLVVVRVNQDYDAKLLEELGVEAVKPWNEFLEFSGVHPKVDEIAFDPPIGSDGIPLWSLDIVRRKLEYDHPDVYLLAVMPHPIGSGTKDESPGWGTCHVAFVSTHPDYMSPDNRNGFISYGKKVAAHEIGHLDPFELEHHETPVRLPTGYCLMYSGKNNQDIRKSLDRTAMGFCDVCYSSARRNQQRDVAFENSTRFGRRLSRY